MIHSRLLALLLLGLLGVGLAVVALPEETTAAPHVYDGDEDDGALVSRGVIDVFIQSYDFGLPRVLVFTRPEFRWLAVDSQVVAVSTSSRLCASLNRAPPVR
jgi:hypothetical protein